jgi:HAD superfamily hydrolase (TIGR01459 family)
MVAIITGAQALLMRYRVLICDVWGVVHDGVTAYPEAGEALARFRANGGTVVLLSNAPAPSSDVMHVLNDKNVRDDAWDGLVTSGDVTRARLIETGVRRVFHIGTDRDRSIFDGLGIELTGIADAQMVVATELENDRAENPEDYRPVLSQCHARGLPFLCGNPDLVVHVGNHLLPCAGALATIYVELGGDVFWAGKPHAPVYAMAWRMAAAAHGKPVAKKQMLAIGDALRTDMVGARDFGIDGLLVAGGIHRDEVMPAGQFEQAGLEAACASFNVSPVAVIDQLRWLSHTC